MKISFTHSLDGLITEQRAKELGEYSKIYTPDNGIIKKEEQFLRNKLYSVVYYLDDNENKNVARAILAPQSTGFDLVETQLYGDGYVIYHHDRYRENRLIGRFKMLYSAGGSSMCFEKLDLETNLPAYEETNKYLGEYMSEDSTHYCKLYYKSDGSLNYCEYNYYHDYDSEEFDLETMPEIKMRFQLSDAEYNYFLTAQLEPVGLV